MNAKHIDKKRIPCEPYLQLWTEEMMELTNDSPFGKECMICFELLRKEDHANAKKIEDNNFLHPNYATPAKYGRNICVCGATNDCFVEGLFKIEDHLTHYMHRKCYEDYIYNTCLKQKAYDSKEKYEVFCPFVKASYVGTMSNPFLRTLKYREIEDGHMHFVSGIPPLLKKMEECPDKVKLDNSWKTDNNNKILYHLHPIYYYSLLCYVHALYIPINDGLRSSRIPELLSFIVENIINLIDAAKPYPEPICFYRGVYGSFVSDVLRNLQIGDIFEAKGFMSQSLKRCVSDEFGSDKMILCYPKDCKFVYLKQFGKNEEQYEVLTYPNQLLRFFKVVDNTHWKEYYFDVIPSTVSISELIESKKLYLTYDYDNIYDQMDDEEREEFKEDFKIFETQGEYQQALDPFIVKKDRSLSIEYYREMITTRPNLILYMLKFTPKMVNDDLWLFALSKDMSLIEHVLKHVKNTSAIQSVIVDALDNGFVIDTDIPDNLLTSDMRIQSNENAKHLHPSKN